MARGPGYTVKDLVFYGGLFAGLIIVVPLARQNGIHPLVGLLGGGVVGMGLGWMMLKAYESMNSQNTKFPGDDDNDRF